MAELVEQARAGRARAVARLITLVESESPVLPALAAALAPLARPAQVIGLTGPPGVGKSTTTTALVGAYRGQGLRVGVLAVDPSSPFSGGALLGDRVRMQEHATDPEVFVRSMASRGHLGGMAAATPQALRVLEAAGCDVVLIETVGVGQGEVDVAAAADTTLVLLAPGMGDGIQAAKAGILEVADVFVVNKADRDGARQAVRDLRAMLSLGGRHTGVGAWRPPVVSTVASQGAGLDDLLTAVAGHRRWLVEHGGLERQRVRRAAGEIEAIALARLRGRMADVRGAAALPEQAAAVAAGRSDPYRAAAAVLAGLGSPDLSSGSPSPG